MLQVPTDKEGLVDKGLLALADFAGGMSLDPTEIDKERGVVIEEWRLRQGASWRILEKQAPVLYYKSRYAERIPIGTPEILRSFPAARLQGLLRDLVSPRPHGRGRGRRHRPGRDRARSCASCLRR